MCLKDLCGEPAILLPTVRGLVLLAGPLHHRSTDTITLSTYRQSWAFWGRSPSFFAFSHLSSCSRAWESSYPWPFLCFPPPPPPLTPSPCSALSGQFQFSSAKLASAPSSGSVSPSPPVLPALSPLRLPLSISPHLRCGNWEMLIWPGAHGALPGPPTYLPLFSTAEAGNLLLACSVVLKCVTGAKWVPVLVNAEKRSTDNEKDLVRKDR